MERRTFIALCIWLSLVSSVALTSLTSYSYYSNDVFYINVVEDPDWVDTLPEALSMEVSEEIGKLLSLSPEATEKVYDAILGSTDDEWAREQGTGVIDDILSYLEGQNDELNYAIDISDQKSPVILSLAPFLPPILAETISDILPDSIPLKALVNMDGLEDTRNIFSFMQYFRYVIVAILIISIAAILYYVRDRGVLKEILYYSSSGSFLSCLAGVLLMALRVKMAFDGMDLSFMSSFGHALNSGYLSSSIIFLMLPLLVFFPSVLIKYRLIRT